MIATRRLVVSLLILGGLSVAAPSVAQADGYGGGPANLRRLVLYRAQAEIDLDLHINLSEDFEGKPIALSPSFYYGFTDRISAGIAHNPYSALGLFGGMGFCFNDCARTYDNITFDFLYLLVPSESFQLALRAGLDILSFDDFTPQGRIGLRGRFTADRLAIVFEPSIAVGEDVFLHLPFWFLFQVSPQFAIGAVTGFNSDFDGSNFFLGLPLLYTPNPNLDFGLLFVFPALDDTADLRSLTFTLAFRF